MAITAQSYFAALRDYLNTKHYEVVDIDDGLVVLTEKVQLPGSDKPRKMRVRLAIPGEALVINLDKKGNGGQSEQLFHFLDDESKPWAKRCDFVIFHLHRDQISAFCIEFKSGSFPESLVDQMNSSAAWCRSLHSIIKHYTGKTKRI